MGIGQLVGIGGARIQPDGSSAGSGDGYPCPMAVRTVAHENGDCIMRHAIVGDGYLARQCSGKALRGVGIHRIGDRMPVGVEGIIAG